MKKISHCTCSCRAVFLCWFCFDTRLLQTTFGDLTKNVSYVDVRIYLLTSQFTGNKLKRDSYIQFPDPKLFFKKSTKKCLSSLIICPKTWFVFASLGNEKRILSSFTVSIRIFLSFFLLFRVSNVSICLWMHVSGALFSAKPHISSFSLSVPYLRQVFD